jgi:hypothetical protein
VTALLLEPHQDDAVLFATFTLLREEPLVVTVLSEANGHGPMRDRENRDAFAVLGLDTRSLWPWPYNTEDPDWDAIRDDFEILARTEAPGRGHLRTRDHGTYERIFAPWPEPGGHPQHNAIGELARDVFGDRVTYYTTYRYGGPRTTGTPVAYEREWVLLKLRALACYESQILRGPVRFFTMALDEYTREAS